MLRDHKLVCVRVKPILHNLSRNTFLLLSLTFSNSPKAHQELVYGSWWNIDLWIHSGFYNLIKNNRWLVLTANTRLHNKWMGFFFWRWFGMWGVGGVLTDMMRRQLNHKQTDARAQKYQKISLSCTYIHTRTHISLLSQIGGASWRILNKHSSVPHSMPLLIHLLSSSLCLLQLWYSEDLHIQVSEAAFRQRARWI